MEVQNMVRIFSQKKSGIKLVQ